MSYSQQYHDPIYHDEVDFADSIIIKPISLKPTVIPSLLNRSNPQNTILGAYDSIKLTEFLDQTQDGHIVQLITLQQNSLIPILTQEGTQFLQRYSAQDIAFITITGQNSSGKSFFLDKILNLSNIHGNNFSLEQSRPSIKIWSSPFMKQQLRFFLAQVCNCSPGSKQFQCLLPYVTLISSMMMNFQSFKQNKQSQNTSLNKLDQRLKQFQNIFFCPNHDDNSLKAQLLNNIFPSIVYFVKRHSQSNDFRSNQLNRSQIRLKQVFLPNAKNKNYAGIDEDLRIHSFLNKKCVQEQYIKKVSQIFKQMVNDILQKKHRELVFNGGILLKYIRYLGPLFNKRKPINIQKVYYEIVKQLYISAYNYCVICYHEALQQALSNQKPRSLDELLIIFEEASYQILQKYNQFSLQKSLHQQYEQKLLSHIQSKEKLILEINKKKTDLQLGRIYDNNIDMTNFNLIWSQINKINSQNPTYTHGRDQTIGRKLGQIITKLKTGNNVDYKIMKQIQRLKQAISIRKTQLNEILQTQQVKSIQINENKKKKQKIDTQLKTLDQQIIKIKKQIQMHQNIDNQDPTSLKQQQKKYQDKIQRNQKIIQKLISESNQPIDNNKIIIDIQKQRQTVKSKIELFQNTLKQLQAQQKNVSQPVQKQIKMKKQQPKQTKQKPKEQKPPQKPPTDSKLKESLKNSKKSGK